MRKKHSSGAVKSSAARYLKILKIAAGSAIAMFLAELLALNYASSAGVITLLTIQDTKKETFFVAARRAAAFILAVLFARLLLPATGFTVWGYGLFLFLFILCAGFLRLSDGIAMNAVLITHLLPSKAVTLPFIVNELLIFLIGSGVGVILNLYIPRNIKQIRKSQLEIENSLRIILKGMAQELKCCHPLPDKASPASPETPHHHLLKELETKIHIALNHAYEEKNNTFLSDTKYYIQYMEMRHNQCSVLNVIDSHIIRLYHTVPQAAQISAFFEHAAASLHEYNNAMALLSEYEHLRTRYCSQPLPETREEFENQATLFQILNELECFLLLKRDFVLELTENQLRLYWDKEKNCPLP